MLVSISLASTINDCCRQGQGVQGVHVAKFLKWYCSRGSIARKLGSCCPTKNTEVLSIVEEAMMLDDEITAVQLHYILRERGIEISLRTV